MKELAPSHYLHIYLLYTLIYYEDYQMKKPTAALLLTLSFLTLLGGISVTKGWLNAINIPVGGKCALSSSDDPTERRVCKNGICILYSGWVKMSDEERETIQ